MLTADFEALVPVLEEMSLARTRGAFAENLEAAACRMASASEARFYEYRLHENALVRPGEAGPNEVRLALDPHTVPGACALAWEPVRAEGPGDPRSVPGVAAPDGVAVALPLLSHGALFGVLALVGPALPEEAVARLAPLAAVAGMAFESASRSEELARYLSRSEELFVKAVEGLGDGPSHVLTVARLASEMGQRLDLTRRAGELLWQAAQWHDVGKIVLQGRAPFEIEQRHSQAGATFLASFPSLVDLAPLVGAHHERYDGSGFPDGRSGDEVPLEGWVLALAEEVAETGGEPENPAGHHPEALEALRDLASSGRLAAILAPGG